MFNRLKRNGDNEQKWWSIENNDQDTGLRRSKKKK